MVNFTLYNFYIVFGSHKFVGQPQLIGPNLNTFLDVCKCLKNLSSSIRDIIIIY